MGYYTIHAVILIPAARLDAANTWLAKQGLGSGVFTRAIILKADPDGQAARGYAGLLRVDAGGYDLLKKVCEGQANCFTFASQNKKLAIQEALAFIDNKGYRLKPM